MRCALPTRLADLLKSAATPVRSQIGTLFQVEVLHLCLPARRPPPPFTPANQATHSRGLFTRVQATAVEAANAELSVSLLRSKVGYQAKPAHTALVLQISSFTDWAKGVQADALRDDVASALKVCSQPPLCRLLLRKAGHDNIQCCSWRIWAPHKRCWPSLKRSPPETTCGTTQTRHRS